MHSPPAADADDRLGALRFVAGYSLYSPYRAFGGLSGIEISDDGRDLLGLSDKGQWLWLRFGLNDDLPDRVEKAGMAPMLDADGVPLSSGWQDAESLVLGDDQVLAGFEGRDLVRRFSLPPETGDIADRLGILPDIRGVIVNLPAVMLEHPHNGGLEAMAILEDGRLLAFSERGRGDDGHLKAWLYKNGQAQALSFAAPSGFYPTDAALLPERGVLVLLRHFSLLGGFAAKVIRIDREDIVPGAMLSGETLATFQSPLSIDNMEGLAVRRGADGEWLLYLLSDDNFFPLQRTILLIYALST